MPKALEHKAAISRLKSSMWTAARIDQKLSKSVTDEYDAREDRARVNKRLIAPAAMKPIRVAIVAAKVCHQALTLPWDAHGDRLLPIASLDRYKLRIAAASEAVDAAVQDFLGEYETVHIPKAREDLGRAFNPEDYPSRDTLRSKFGVTYEILPIPKAEHFIADVGEEEAARIRERIEMATQARLDSAMVALYENVQAPISRLIERLGFDDEGKALTLHETAVENLRDIANAIPDMNLTDDPRLGEISEQITEALKDVSVDDLRFKSRKVQEIEATARRRRDLTAKLEQMQTSYFGGAQVC